MQAIKVIEPRVNIKDDLERNHIVLQGGLRYTEQTHTADSYGSLGAVPVQALWTIYPPSTHTIVDRLFRVRMYVQVELLGGDFLDENDAPRQFPIHSMTDVLTVQINGESISDNIGDKVHAMLCYGNNREQRNRTWSQTCAMPDQYQRLGDWATYGNAKNPLSNYGVNSAEDPRGGFPYEEVSASVRRYTVTEPILMSPFYDGLGNQVEGFVNVNQFNIAYRFKADPSRFWSHADNLTHPGVTGARITLFQAPEILTTFITPDLTQPIPRLLTLPYHKTQDYLKTVPPLNIGEVRRMLSDSIKLSQIPRRIYLFVRRSRDTSTYNTADSFAGINRVSILWNNESGLFGNGSKQELFEICRRNGLNSSFSQFVKYRGSVMCIELGTQLGLLDNEASGVRGQYTMQIEIDVQNLSGEAGWQGEFYTLMLMEGTFQISENMGRATLGNLTADVALRAKNSPELDHGQYQDMRGEGFFSSLKNFINKVARGVQTGVGVAEKALPLLATAFPELAPVAGAIPAISAGAKLARGLTGGRLAGGRLAGGRITSRRGMKGGRYR